MVIMATKMMWPMNYIIDQNTKYGEDYAEIDEAVRSCFIQEYFR